MECSDISINRRKEAAATLVEFLIALGIAGLIMMALASFMYFSGRSYAALVNYVDLDRNSRNTLDQMTFKIRQADGLLEFSSNKLVFQTHGSNTLTYLYSPDRKTLTETFNSSSKVLLKQCDVLVFDIFQRNTAIGTYDQFPATLSNNAAKLVRVSWTCSRTVLGRNLNTESVQSAKIVIRNQ